MLRVVHGNHLELLRDLVVEQNPSRDPFSTSTIVVTNRSVQRWLTLQLATTNQVACGVRFLQLNKLLVEAFSQDHHAKAAGLRALDRNQLQAALASVFAEAESLAEGPSWLGPIAPYLAQNDAPAEVRRVQLARQLGNLLWEYAETRPDWLEAWDSGMPGPDGDHAGWQRALYSRLRSHLAACGEGDLAKRYALTPQLPAARQQLSLPPPQLPGTVHIVSGSFLSASTLSAIAALAVGNDVIVYQLNPCAEFWEDVPARSRGRSQLLATSTRATAEPFAAHADAGQPDPSDPLVLQLWGRPARDTVSALTTLADGDLTAVFVDESDPSSRRTPTALTRLRADAAVRASSPDTVVANEAGVRILACPTAARELEIVAAEISSLLAADKTLRAPEIGVLIAGDSSAYIPLVPVIFDENNHLPYHILDEAVADSGRLPEAFTRILELPGSDFARRDLLAVMCHPHVISRYPHANPEQWIRYTERLGVFRGADKADHAGTYLEASPNSFHWQQALTRLALGTFLDDDCPHDPAVTLGESTLVPEPVPTDQRASAGTFALLARSLIADARWLALLRATLSRWAQVLDGMVAAYLTATTPTDEQDLTRLRSTIFELRSLDLDGREVTFGEVRELLAGRIAGLRGDRGEPLLRGVTVASLSARRPLPFRHLFVLGLGATDFPRADSPNPYDLRTTPRRGDVSRRDADRHAFFDTLLSTRDTLTLSYVARHAVSGELLEPSSAVHELAEAMAPYLGAATAGAALAQLTTHHPLHRFSPRYESELALQTGRSSGATAERDAVAVHESITSQLLAENVSTDPNKLRNAVFAWGASTTLTRLGLPPRADARTQKTAAGRVLHLSALRKFLESPVQAWASEVLGLDDDDDETDAIEVSDEPLEVDALGRSIILREALVAAFRAPEKDLAELMNELVERRAARGVSPIGPFARATRTVDLELLMRWCDGPIRTSNSSVLSYGIGRGADAQTKVVPPLALSLPSHSSTEPAARITLVGQAATVLTPSGSALYMSMSKDKGKAKRQQLRAALDHVVLAAAGILHDQPHQHVVFTGAGEMLQTVHKPWSQAAALAYLGSLAQSLLTESHGYLLPWDLAWAVARGEPVPSDSSDQLGFGPVQRSNDLDPPTDDEVESMVKVRFVPLLEHLLLDDAPTKKAKK